MRFTWILGPALLLGACAPSTTYVPSPALVPLFSKPGQVYTGANVGPQGVQINAAYSVSSDLMLRLFGHTERHDESHYDVFSAGGGWFFAQHPRSEWWPGLRGSVDADFGLGETAGVEIVQSNGLPHRRSYQGFLYRVGLQADVGIATTYVEVGGAARLVYLSLRHGQSSDEGDGSVASWWIFEPAGVMRFGLEHLKLELQGGWSKPVATDGVVGDYRRWFTAVGLVGELD